MQVLPKDSHKKERAICSLAETLSRLWGSRPHSGIVTVSAIDAEQCQCKIFAKMHLRETEVIVSLDGGATVNILPIGEYKQAMNDPVLN